MNIIDDFVDFLSTKIDVTKILPFVEEFKNNEDDIYFDCEETFEPDKKTFNIISNICDDLFFTQKRKSIWNRSYLENIDELKIDYSGKIGELFIINMAEILNIPCISNGNINSKDGTYDVILYSKKVEIKTARYGNVSKTFQHESLRNEGCDYYMFIDLKPDYLYITILPKFDLNKKCEIIKRKPHLRKGTTNVYKFDFTEKNLENALEKNYSIKITEKTSLEELYDFIDNSLNHD